MAKADTKIFLQRRLNSKTNAGITLIDAIAMPKPDEHKVRLFFKAGTPQDAFLAGDGLKIMDGRSIGDSPMLNCVLDRDDQPLKISVGKARFEIEPQAAETDLFKGMNVLFGVRNGESPKIVAQWLHYHAEHHGMQAALILDRAQPGRSKGFFSQLKKQAGDIKGLKRVVLLDAKIPLGKNDCPAEAHPFNVPGAPGKDRMKIPDADPWNAPLGELLIYELARARFLNTARAVANIEVYDLLAPAKGPNVFDRTCASKTGCLLLEGVQAYPWRIRNNDKGGFGDHICVQFDAKGFRKRWCVAPDRAGDKSVWRLIRVVGCNPQADETARYHRYMALRHPPESVSKIVPKTSLIEDEKLIRQAEDVFDHKPVRMPEEKLAGDKKKIKSSVKLKTSEMKTTIVTTMKNEGPFILEWLAFHRVIGVTDFLVYTNDCTDGTDTMLQMLQTKGIVQHRENPFVAGGALKPQHAALQAAENEPVVTGSDWLICMDVDEFINIHVGDGNLSDLFDATNGANMISLTWRLFGNADVHEFQDKTLCETFTRCAPQLARKPHQAWGFKTLFRNLEIFKKLGVHRPKGLKPQLWEDIHWVNGSGKEMPHNMYRNGWRSTANTYGYDLVTLNHYAVRSAESFLVKRDRGRVNHVDRDQGLSYWFRMNNNAEQDRSIQRMLPRLQAELDKLMADPDIAAAHEYSVKKHRAKIDELKAGDAYSAFYTELTGPRLQRLSRLHTNFGANVFLMGPGVIPDEISEHDPDTPFFFTVEKGKTTH